MNAGAGRFVEVSDRLIADLGAALWAALTDGLIDPTVGQALIRLGYDRDFADLAGTSTEAAIKGSPAASALATTPGWPPMITFTPVPGWQAVSVDRPGRRARVPAGARVDLGSTAKARCADLAARSAAEAVGCGVLVGLGGDVSVAGVAPDEGWSIRVTDDARASVGVPGQMIAIQTGGLATSGTTVRSGNEPAETCTTSSIRVPGSRPRSCGVPSAWPREAVWTPTWPRRRRWSSAATHLAGCRATAWPPGWCAPTGPSSGSEGGRST